MARAPQVLLLCCVLQGLSCNRWVVEMPNLAAGLSGSCVLVPCTFTLPSEWEPYLDRSCRAVWKRGSWSRTLVFDSGANASSNIVQGNLTGNLQDKDCSTVFYNLPPNHYDHYYFRVECEQLKFNFQNSVLIKIQDSLPSPTLSPSSLEVEEGATVTLNCTAVSPCPSQAPVLEWSPCIEDIVESLEARLMTSVMNFTASHLHDGVKFSCSALYSRPAVSTGLLYQTSLTLHVLYSPKNTSVRYPGPVREGSPVTLSCGANANPAVDTYSWYRADGDQVTEVGSTQNITTIASETHNRFFCQVSNKYGIQNSSIIHIEVKFPPKNTTVQVEPPGVVMEGSSVSLVCVTHSNPPVSHYSWFRDGQEEDGVRGAVLVRETADPSHSGTYHCKARNELGEDKSASVQLDIQYPPKMTSVSSAPPGPVEEGSSVTLSCSTDTNPATVNFTWYRVSGRLTAVVGRGREYSFNVTKLSEDQYYCGAVNTHGAEFSQPVSINVTFAPEILSSSRCVKILSQIRCTCDSQGNPGPSLQWELSGERVNHSALTPITEGRLSSVRTRSTITLHALDQGMPSLVCHSVSALGSDSLVYNVSSSHIQLGLHTLSLLIGSATGALGMFLLCLPLLLFLCRKSKNNHLPYKKVREPSDTVITNEANPSKVLLNHVNGALTDLQDGEEMDPILHLIGDSVELVSKATEDIHQYASNGREEGKSPDRHSANVKDVNGLNEQVSDKARE